MAPLDPRRTGRRRRRKLMHADLTAHARSVRGLGEGEESCTHPSFAFCAYRGVEGNGLECCCGLAGMSPVVVVVVGMEAAYHMAALTPAGASFLDGLLPRDQLLLNDLQ